VAFNEFIFILPRLSYVCPDFAHIRAICLDFAQKGNTRISFRVVSGFCPYRDIAPRDVPISPRIWAKSRYVTMIYPDSALKGHLPDMSSRHIWILPVIYLEFAQKGIIQICRANMGRIRTTETEQGQNKDETRRSTLSSTVPITGQRPKQRSRARGQEGEGEEESKRERARGRGRRGRGRGGGQEGEGKRERALAGPARKGNREGVNVDRECCRTRKAVWPCFRRILPDTDQSLKAGA